MVFDSYLYTVVLTSCMDTFYCFSLFLLSDCSLSRNKITSDGVREFVCFLTFCSLGSNQISDEDQQFFLSIFPNETAAYFVITAPPIK